MKPFPLRLLTGVLLVTGLFAAGCSRAPQAAGGGGGHVHVAPHGGTLIELGDHQYNLELVRDAAAGKLTVYVLDGHAENFVRIAAPSIELVAIAEGQRRPLELRPVANSATGETVGDTSQFEAQADWLKTVGDFPGTITSINVRGTTFNSVGIYLRK